MPKWLSDGQLAAAIRRVREGRQESQAEFARSLGAPGLQSDVSKWEKGTKRPGLATLERIAELVGADLTMFQEEERTELQPLTMRERVELRDWSRQMRGELDGALALIDRALAATLPGAGAAISPPRSVEESVDEAQQVLDERERGGLGHPQRAAGGGPRT